MRYGVRRSVRAYRLEGDKYPEWRFQIHLTSVREMVNELSRVLGVSTPSVNFRSMSRTYGKYRQTSQSITISRYDSTIRCSTVIHEFAHHLNYILNGRTGHDEYFLDTLDKTYAAAKERYFGLLEKHKSEAYAHQAERQDVREQQEQRVVEARSKFRVGQRVSFNGRHGRTIEGTIHKVNRKTLTIRDCNDGGLGWKVGVNNSALNILVSD